MSAFSLRRLSFAVVAAALLSAPALGWAAWQPAKTVAFFASAGSAQTAGGCAEGCQRTGRVTWPLHRFIRLH